MKTLNLLLFLVLTTLWAKATNLETVQTIRGKVIDQDTKVPLIGANVVVVNSTPFKGASTDIDGNFRIADVPLGRVDLKITFLGYEEKVLGNQLLGAGKELVLTIELTESLVKLQTVEITATANKGEVINEMATVSARQFSVEETKRYAGSFNDPARMVSSFAGVAGDASGNNDIIVRGNSSKGILWRLEGVEIPNPNHFSGEGLTGGPINALNSSMLDNSDFYSGAFAPEYGNAFSGILDMKLRTGNNEKREYSFGIGVLGTDFTAEGPFKVGGNASYLVNYRYSSLALLDQAGLVDFYGIPKYQDASFKVNLPTKKAGVFSIWGLGGYSTIDQEDKSGDTLFAKSVFTSHMATGGINHMILLNEKAYLKSFVSLSENASINDYWERNDESSTLDKVYIENLGKQVARVGSTLNYKWNARHKMQLGFIYSQQFFGFETSYKDREKKKMVELLHQDGNAGYLQAFTSMKSRLGEDVTLVYGAHYMVNLLNNKQSFEPRAAIKYQLDGVQSVNLGVGIHSRMEPITVYLSNVEAKDGTTSQANKNLGLAKSAQVVVGYDRLLGEHLRLKAEAYYQYLYDVPVSADPTESFSLINATGGFNTLAYVNKGAGRNYGVELTLERFFNKGFYYLATASLYDAKYRAQNDKLINSAFNGHYVGNFLLGKEFRLGKAEKGRTLALNAKINYMGGLRLTPIDLAASQDKGFTVFDNTALYSKKAEDVFKANVAISYRKNHKSATSEFKIDIQNVTNNQAMVGEYYNSRTRKIEAWYQLSLLPVISYKLEF